MPGKATVFRWIARHKEFRDEYTLACELRAEDLADEMIEIADDPCVWVEKIGADGLVPLHRGFDWLIFGHFRMGRFSGATSSSMLRATPGWRRIKPARSMVRTI